METYKLPKTGGSTRRELRIVQDTDAENPRKDCDYSSEMVCFHGRYNLGDDHEFSGPDELDEVIKSAAVVLPLYLYDHSGITISTTPFSCPWDSGQVGYIFISEEKMIECYGENNEATRATAEAVLKSEVETYDQYLRGDVYGFEVVETTQCSKHCSHEDEEVVDSCWGFYGDDLEENGILHHLDEADAAFVRDQL